MRLTLLLGFLLLVTLFVVGKRSVPESDRLFALENGKPKVLVTTTMILDLVRYIGDDTIDTLPLIRGDLDPHSYELVKGDGEKLERADLVFYNGLGLEHGWSLRHNLENNPKAHAVGSVLPESTLFYVDGKVDPHVWMDVSLWSLTLAPIVDALTTLVPEKGLLYQKRAASLLEKLNQLDRAVMTKLQKISPEKRYLVTSHDAFNYFAKRYLATEKERSSGMWQKRVEAPEGLAPEAKLGIKDVQKIIEHVKTFDIHILFPETNVNRDSLNKILQAGASCGLTLAFSKEALFADACGEHVGAYFDMIEHNVRAIAKEMGRDEP